MALCFFVMYRESMQTCWVLASAFNLLGDFSSNLAALCMISNGPYHLAVWEERVAYLIMMHVITPLIEVIFALLLQKLGILRVFWDWLTQKEFAFSLYPVWEYGIFAFLHVNRSQWGEAYSSYILVSVCFVALFVIERQKELKRKQIAAQRVMMQQQNAYIESLEGLQREVQRFRHDYKNRQKREMTQLGCEKGHAAFIRIFLKVFIECRQNLGYNKKECNTEDLEKVGQRYGLFILRVGAGERSCGYKGLSKD